MDPDKPAPPPPPLGPTPERADDATGLGDLGPSPSPSSPDAPIPPVAISMDDAEFAPPLPAPSPGQPHPPADAAPQPPLKHPSYFFLAFVAIVSLASDIGSKTWAEKRLDGFPGIVNVWKDHIAFVLAKNKGGAWGLLQGTPENVRRPFFLLVSVAAIAFIVTLYRRLLPSQRALKWGLPLVLGGALGNVFDRIRYGHVIDFIDVHLLIRGKDHHWPTFNVADIAICVGVGLMAIDMFTSKRPKPMAPAAAPTASPTALDPPLVAAPHPAANPDEKR